MYDLVSSATVTLTAVFLLLNIATLLRAYIVTYDIKGAFLNAPFTEEDEPTYLRIKKDVADIWITVDPTAVQYLNDKGELLLLLDKFIYGLKQSPLKFQQHLIGTLTANGYRQSINDECVLYKYTKEGELSIISVHVDDMLQIDRHNQKDNI